MHTATTTIAPNRHDDDVQAWEICSFFRPILTNYSGSPYRTLCNLGISWWRPGVKLPNVL